MFVVFAPELLQDTRELSLTVSIVAMVLGVALMLYGWRGHRFWIVLASTMVAGIMGLTHAPLHGGQPLVAGLLAAIAGGFLALSLIKLIAFVAAGLLACVVASALVPSWDHTLVTALAGGLLGVALFRFWTMAVTSALGTTVLGYATLSLLDRLRTLDSVSWATTNTVLLNGVWAGVALLGLLTQILLERYRIQKEREAEDKAKAKASAEAEARNQKPAPAPAPKLSWFGALLAGVQKRLR